MSRGPRSSSSPSSVSLTNKVRENLKLLGLWIERFRSGGDVGRIVDTVEEYAQVFEQKTGRKLEGASIFEIGYGARPLRMMTFHSMGLDASGVDLERPALEADLKTILKILQRNGFERALKSAIRTFLFDKREERVLAERMAQGDVKPFLDPRRLIVADAADVELAQGSLDLIVSEDVFEHIGIESLERVAHNMAKWLKPDGLALIRPMVFTGIAGNHLIDWYPHRILAGNIPSNTEPWEHLRQKRVQANTYLNQLSRSDYRELFEKEFTIDEERVRYPDLGRDLMTPQVADELREWPEDELFSNSVQFVLRPKTPAQTPMASSR